jgi:hypothetical protein
MRELDDLYPYKHDRVPITLAGAAGQQLRRDESRLRSGGWLLGPASSSHLVLAWQPWFQTTIRYAHSSPDRAKA